MKYTVMLAVAVLVFLGTWLHGQNHGMIAERVKWQAAQAEAIQKAIQTERNQQKATNDAIQKQADDFAVINATLSNDLDRLRNRTERVRTILHPGTACKGANGSELSRPDAEFLTREAARADAIRTALIACYAYADGLQQ